jgi:site-specific recombinase XerD
MTALAPHLTAFMRERLPIVRGASPHTCEAYAYTFQLLLNFASTKLHASPASLSLEQIDASLICEFLDHLRTARHNRPRTRNARLAAIKSFMRVLEYRVPGALEQVAQVLEIPFHRCESKVVRHLTPPEQKALLDVPDPSARMGIRDRAMFHLALSAGLRVSELVGLKMEDLHFDGSYVDILVHGKGRKERHLRLWKSVADTLRTWLSVRGQANVPEVFLNALGGNMTRAGFEYVLARCYALAVKSCPSLQAKRLSPHVLRHTCALTALKATGDIRQVALWLGHASTTSTEIYLELDPLDKLQAIAGVVPPMLKPGKFRPPDRLIAALRGDPVMPRG